MKLSSDVGEWGLETGESGAADCDTGIAGRVMGAGFLAPAFVMAARRLRAVLRSYIALSAAVTIWSNVSPFFE